MSELAGYLKMETGAKFSLSALPILGNQIWSEKEYPTKDTVRETFRIVYYGNDVEAIIEALEALEYNHYLFKEGEEIRNAHGWTAYSVPADSWFRAVGKPSYGHLVNGHPSSAMVPRLNFTANQVGAGDHWWYEFTMIDMPSLAYGSAWSLYSGDTELTRLSCWKNASDELSIHAMHGSSHSSLASAVDWGDKIKVQVDRTSDTSCTYTVWINGVLDATYGPFNNVLTRNFTIHTSANNFRLSSLASGTSEWYVHELGNNWTVPLMFPYHVTKYRGGSRVEHRPRMDGQQVVSHLITATRWYQR